MMNYIYIVYLWIFFILGLIMGSFFNVVIYRLPQRESIVHGSSHCPQCQSIIKPYDLIPLFSYLSLGGKCRYCHTKISLRYPFIELLTALMYGLVYHVYGLSLTTALGLVLTSILIIVAMIDIDTMEIYDRFHIMILGLAIGYLFITPNPILNHVIGFFIISVPFYIIAYLTQGIGGGDIKLIAVAGLLLGYQATIVTFVIASISGGLVAILLIILKQQNRKSLIAFGPFLCLGIYISFLYGDQIAQWYLTFL